MRAIPNTEVVEPAWKRPPPDGEYRYQLNRSHVVHGEVAYLLPCLGRLEVDEQANGP
jgi:hypothetical protein